MFIIPFYQNLQNTQITPEMAVDVFFNNKVRTFFYAKAIKTFRIPGQYVDPDRTTGNGHRTIPEGKIMLCVVDNYERTTKVMVRARDRFDEFILNEADAGVFSRLVVVLE